MKNIIKNIKKPFVFLGIVLVIAVFVVVRKIQYYSADSIGEKDCPPLFPNQENELLKQTISEVDTLRNNLPWSQKGGVINDASCLNKTMVHGIVSVRNVDDIKDALIFAQKNNLKVSIAGVKHSMGGHAFSKGALVLDMTQFNKMTLDEKNKVLRVESGATWHDIQNLLHPKFAVKAMQSTDIFTVGGSISVNAHGMDHRAGAVAGTIRSMRVMLPDGSIKVVNKNQNSDLFNLVIGGYGLFGIVLDADIEVVENVVYQSNRKVINYTEFPRIFDEQIKNDKSLGLFYAHLSTGPRSFMKEMIFYTYKTVDTLNHEVPPLGEVSGVKLRRFIFNFAKLGSLPRHLKWLAEKYIEPMLEDCPISRNQALGEGEACLVSRNSPMHDSVPYLRNNLKNDTDILQEYFIPRDKFVSYIDEMRKIILENGVNVLNVSVRIVDKENNFLNYAPEDVFSVVLYINQKTDEKANEQMKKINQELIDLTVRNGGTFFLPYQLHYSVEQLEQSYPNIKAFFDAKKIYDPNTVLTNTFYEKYSGLVK